MLVTWSARSPWTSTATIQSIIGTRGNMQRWCGGQIMIGRTGHVPPSVMSKKTIGLASADSAMAEAVQSLRAVDLIKC
jgi:hypothetical protein